jgi:hypothetical protein
MTGHGVGHSADSCSEISCQIVNGLFTITGVGLIPWRAMDTYSERPLTPRVTARETR